MNPCKYSLAVQFQTTLAAWGCWSTQINIILPDNTNVYSGLNNWRYGHMSRSLTCLIQSLFRAILNVTASTGLIYGLHCHFKAISKCHKSPMSGPSCSLTPCVKEQPKQLQGRGHWGHLDTWKMMGEGQGCLSLPCMAFSNHFKMTTPMGQAPGLCQIWSSDASM